MKAPFDLTKISDKPGCYIYKDITDTIIYVGKAKNLKKRVSSYFSKNYLDLKTAQLVENIKSVETIITKNEVEALLLESNLIRQHKPRYNIDLKYGMRYAWIVLTNEEYPRLITARSRNLDGEYFGPFVSGNLRRVLLDVLRKKFYIRTCRVLPKKPCLRYHIGVCKAPCVKKQTQKEYEENVEQVRTYLRGKNKELIKDLQKQMKEAAAKTNFELAKIHKEQIDSLEYLQNQMLVENSRLEEQDVINYKKYTSQKDNKDYVEVIVFGFRRGVLSQKQTFTIADEENALEEFIKRFYEVEKPPSEIIIPHEIEDNSLEKYLEEISGHKVSLTIPQRGMKKELLELVDKNIDEEISYAESLAFEIKDNLNLEKPVRTIECFDISHLGGTNTVASMVHFKDGKPVKSKYRKFKIQTVEGIDDFRSMNEVITRRYSRLKKEKREYPDLILIDGGSQQVAFAKKALDAIGVNIPMVGLAKKFEEIYFPDKKDPIRFDKNSNMMKVFINARDETHRFGVTFQRSLRSKELKK
ncbi:excinuclease ABC subunit UvrC [Candidatus Woesearchaeota archaeon]|nr:excinuclease ABC subunit UvrC [Candidatus Woesearchaeota archaeon]